MGNSKKQNKGRGKKKTNKNQSKKSPSTNTLPPSVNNNKQSKKPLYKSGFFWDFIGIVISIIAFFRAEQSTTTIVENSNENRNVVVDTIKTSTDTILSSVGLSRQYIIEEFKKYSEDVKALLKQPISMEEYEKDKAIQQRKYEEFQDSMRKEYDFKLDSIKKEIVNSIIQGINYVYYPNWSELFNRGYALFRIDLNGKLYVSIGDFSSLTIIDWSKLKLDRISSSVIDFSLPEVHNFQTGSIFVGNKLGINRTFDDLNKLKSYSFLSGSGLEMSYGIISDNVDGVLGIIGFTDLNRSINNENILNYDRLQQLTQIDFNYYTGKL